MGKWGGERGSPGSGDRSREKREERGKKREKDGQMKTKRERELGG